jgi:hypothetical protein
MKGMTEKLLLDMVHHNPGEAPFQSRFLDPAHLADFGFNGQVFKHLNCVITYAATGVDVYPHGSPDREWLDAFTPGIIAEIAAAKACGLKVFYHLDLFVLPSRLVDHFREEICDPQTGRILLDRPRTLDLHRVLLDEIAARFPEVDGFIIRVGETYLMDTPFHTGNGPIPRIGGGWTPTYLYEETLGLKPAGEVPWTCTQVDAYVKLIAFLRDEICEKHGRALFFRTWDIFPDRLHARLDHYLEVTGRIEPHPLLAFSIKHTALDFWRRVKVNECLGQGRHLQIIEVQCQREYEGKGAYPNYVMDGVVNGFEENETKMGLKDFINDPKILGVYSWSRGGGWYGPYISNELWPDINAFVLARFVRNPGRSEEGAFREYASENLGLRGGDIDRFRQLCLLSSRAILKGRYCEAFDRLLHESVLPCACWMRDDRLGGDDQLRILLDALAANGQLDQALAEKADAMALWEEISSLAARIDWPAGGEGGFVRLSAEYGRILFGIVHQGWRVMIEGRRANPVAVADAIACYDELWAEFRRLGAQPGCPSLYQGSYFSLPGAPPVSGLDETVRRQRMAVHV